MPYVFPRAPHRDRARGAQSRSARPYPLWRAARRSRRRSGAITPLRRRRERTRPPARWPRFSPRASAEHLEFAREAGAEALLRRGGWIKAFRSARGQDMASKEAEELKPYGIAPKISRPGRADRARAAFERRGGRRRALRRSAVDARSRSAGAELRRAVRKTRRADGDGRRAQRSSPRAAAGWSRSPPAGSPRPTS